VIRSIRSELYKFSTTPGPWVILLINTGLTAALVAGSLYGSRVGGYNPRSVADLRDLMGAGYTTSLILAPLVGVLCITTEYRHKIITTSLLVNPDRPQLLVAKGIATAIWSLLLAVVDFILIFAWAIPAQSAAGGSISLFLRQSGVVVPGVLIVYVLLGLFGLGFGILVKNQVAAVLLTIGGTLILENLVIALLHHFVNVNLNWLPSPAAESAAGYVARNTGNGGGLSGFTYLNQWAGALVLLAWGVGPALIGYFTTFRRDVT
jgi:ABC-2 type transport system permease protein